MALLAFDKYEGLGNDFVVLDVATEDDVPRALAIAMCDRRRGVGADGVILVLPAREASAAARMRVVNADGSVPEMCGNGLRCVALHVARTLGEGARTFGIETDAGLRTCAIERASGGDDASVLCDMGVVRVLDEVTVHGVTFTRADAGNPHAVALRAIARDEFERLGPRVSTDAAFANGTNVEFARLDGDVLEVVVWERGAGPTLACGTGACASVAVAAAKGIVGGDATVRVRLPGGELAVRRDARSGMTSMRGPARRVFSGLWSARRE